MKKLLMLFLIGATALNCSDDDKTMTNLGTNPSLTGTWKLTEIYDGTTPVVTSACDLNNQLKFNADNTVEQTVAVSSGTQCNTNTFSGVYVVVGASMTISTLGTQQGYEILEQTSTKLHLQQITGDGDVPSIVYTKQ